MIPYYGKPNEQPISYHVKGVKETVKYLVRNLQSYFDLQERRFRLTVYIPLSRWRSGFFFFTTLPVWIFFRRIEEAFLKKLKMSRKESHFPINAIGNQRKMSFFYIPT